MRNPGGVLEILSAGSNSGGNVYLWVNFDSCACGETQTAKVILGKKSTQPLKDRMDAAVQKVLAKVKPPL